MRDTIYRDEAVEIHERWRQRAKEHYDRDGWYMADILLRFMKEMPSADRPQGEWIGEADGYADGEFIYDTWYCSNCDYVIDDDEPPAWNFCPNCGARMK